MNTTSLEVYESKSLQNKQDILYAKVVIDLPVSIKDNDFYFYSIPKELRDEVKPGTVVHIPFGKQELNGYVIEISDESQSGFEIKPIYSVIYTDPIWDKNFLNLAEWMSHYYLTNTGTILSASVSSNIFDQYIHEITLIKPELDINSRTKEQLFIIEKLLKSKNKRLSYKYLNQKAKFNKHRFYQLINQLKLKGIIKVTSHWKKASKSKYKNNTSVYDAIQLDKKNIILNKEQKEAYENILKTIINKKHEVFLLHGVTGSGKTEVYLRLIEEALKQNKNAVYLVPEIYLIPQTYQRLKSKFQDIDIVIWHSALNKNERFKNWESLRNNKGPKIILGARSAILSPINNIGIIIADEAYEASYKQSGQTPRYDAIKVAIKRGDIENCPVVLGTATPNINDYYECSQRNTILELPNRINDTMPLVHIIDLKTEYPRSYKNIISNSLKANIETALKRNEQIILLLNRRGYSSHVFCRACGHTIFCRNCSVPMVYHKNLHALICHHCGNEKFIGKELILQCPECKSPHFGHMGIGTQQLEDETKKLFPGARVLRVDSDQLKRKDEYIKLWQSFSSHNSDILIGTQIVAKGIDIPDVTVVGVIMADTMLNFPDYVSYERAFQLLTQVTGRAGRREKKGIVFIQTYKPEEPLFKYIKEHDYKSFYNDEIKHRKELLYPPFTKLHRIIIQSYDEKECINYANEIVKNLSHQSLILGPAPCFFSKLHGKYRYHILCKINDDEIKSHLFRDLLNNARKNAKVEVIIDIDSINLL